jgi:hypothetical protein
MQLHELRVVRWWFILAGAAVLLAGALVLAMVVVCLAPLLP